MQMDEKVLKPINEVRYLHAENVERYRTIIRYFYNEYENVNYNITTNEIYQMMKEYEIFSDYTLDNCQNDLNSLVSWNNLTAVQDSTKATTIQEFKNKKFRYQISEATIEIEKMMLTLENSHIEGVSLEMNLIERLAKLLLQFPKILESDDEQIYVWYTDVNHNFKRLNDSYKGFLRDISSQKNEELMQTLEFLLFKDQLKNYLNTFIQYLRRYGQIIAEHLNNHKDQSIDKICEVVLNEDLKNPLRKASKEDIYNNVNRKWNIIMNWFVNTEQSSELMKINKLTTEIISKMTRYAQQIHELKHRNANRKQEYIHMASVFAKSKDIIQAHLLSSQCFGVSNMFHLSNLDELETDNTNTKVYELNPTIISIDPRRKIVKNPTIRTKQEDRSLEKMIQQQMIMAEIEKQNANIKDLIIDNKIVFRNLPLIDKATRNTLLIWISKTANDSTIIAKTDFNASFRVKVESDEYVQVQCEDGVFSSLDYVIEFVGGL